VNLLESFGELWPVVMSCRFVRAIVGAGPGRIE
jgi:hypothetical protein